ncbi:MAG TPA: glycosyltransferase [Myxococcales bacterium]|nr:glycosyltransferase [Myxococcales bacterium]
MTMEGGLDAYRAILGDEEIDEIHRLARPLRGASVQHVNSTAVGGGVAEILARLVPLMREVGLSATWDVMTGSARFFAVTKALHNALHGAPADITPEMIAAFEDATATNLTLVRGADFTIIHDPQPVGLVRARGGDGRWLWRCHIDLSDADPRAFALVRRYVDRYDAAVLHLADYAQPLAIPQLLIMPAIDPFSAKNEELSETEVARVLDGFGIDRKRPIVLQVSRFDRLKDPLGVVRAFQIARAWHDCQLVLAGGGADDDPEGERVLAEVREAAGKNPDIHILSLPPTAHREINALQRGATVVVQKSLREGFGLVVTEAMWKGKPVVGGAVGGIRRQIVHDATGFLVHSVEGTAYRIRQLLTNPGLARRLGQAARQVVLENFLLPTYLKQWTLALLAVREGGRGVSRLAIP